MPDHSLRSIQDDLLQSLNAGQYCTPPKVFIGTITLLQIIFFLLTKYAPEGIGSHSYSDNAKVLRCSCLIYNPYRRKDIWRFFTYMFLHGDWVHLAWNVAIQLLVGLPLEMEQPGLKGTLRVAGLFTVGIIVGGLGSGIVEHSKYLIGSSPGTYALIMAHVATVVLYWNEDGQLDEEQKKEDSKIRNRAFLQKHKRLLPLILVLVFMLTDAGLTLNNINNKWYKIVKYVAYALIMAYLVFLALKKKKDVELNQKQNQNQEAKEEGKRVRPRANLKKKFRIGRLIFVIAFMLTDAVLTIKNVILCERENHYCKNVSRAGHAFGALIGLTVGVFILQSRKVAPWEQKLKIAAFILSGILIGSLIIWHLLGGPEWFTVMASTGDLHCTNPTPLCAYE